MGALTAGTRALFRRLLAWDRERVARIRALGYDTSVYEARQGLAELLLDAEVETWPPEVRELFQAVLEVTRTPFEPASQHRVGILSNEVRRPPLSPQEVEGYKAAAAEIGVIARLIAVAPQQWM